MYQPLYIRDPDSLGLVFWLAEDQPIFDAQRKTLTIHLRQMQWDDGTEFGAEDVVFTGETLKKFRVPKYHDHWEFVEKIEALDKRTVQLTIDRPLATLYTRTNLDDMGCTEKAMGTRCANSGGEAERSLREGESQGKGGRKGAWGCFTGRSESDSNSCSDEVHWARSFQIQSMESGVLYPVIEKRPFFRPGTGDCRPRVDAIYRGSDI